MPAKRELTMRQLRYLLRLHHEGVSTRAGRSTSGCQRKCRRAILGSLNKHNRNLNKHNRLSQNRAAVPSPGNKLVLNEPHQLPLNGAVDSSALFLLRGTCPYKLPHAARRPPSVVPASKGA